MAAQRRCRGQNRCVIYPNATRMFTMVQLIIMRTLPQVQTLATLMFTMVQPIIMRTLPRVQTLATLMFTMVQLIIMRTLPQVQTLATLMFTMVQPIIMRTLPRVQTLELSTIQGSDKEHLEAKPQLWKLVYRSASGYRNAIPSWIKRLLSSKTNVYIEGL
ncbi:hypothetical protein MAR_000167 [Mya arenaria]|uniref:Uncharacterized protein n=1 Tax=Mya arenaria TaxID=6604 RepID=A0ABY7FAE7_MYAAR|nr:hypothetical protein MAR_000167 [Mya arenaria]